MGTGGRQKTERKVLIAAFTIEQTSGAPCITTWSKLKKKVSRPQYRIKFQNDEHRKKDPVGG